MSKSKILFFLSGSIAAFKACQVISRLVQEGHEVQAVATPSALQFVGAATLEGLTGNKVLNDLWQEGRAMDHISLSRWADLGILCPASAHTIANVAHGLAGDVVSTMMLAWPAGKPLHVFPAMNREMLAKSVTQENLAKLSAMGLRVHPTLEGNLACGEVGGGRLLEPEDILAAIRPQALGHVLITAGATREWIDGIRFISNVSTGQTGALLADRLMSLGWQVTYLHGQGAVLPVGTAEKIQFTDFADLDEKLRQQLSALDFRAVVHCAAVSDYSLASVNNEAPTVASKLSSDAELVLKLKSNFKILPRLKEYSRNKEVLVIGFKLTLNAAEDQTAEKARGLLSETVDAVVANDWSQVNTDRRRHPGVLISRDHARPFDDLPTLANWIHDFAGVKHGSLS